TFLNSAKEFMVIGVLKERAPETRVSLIPEVVAALVKMNVPVWIESGAGGNAYYSDAAYAGAGGIVKEGYEIRGHSHIPLVIHADDRVNDIKRGMVIMGVYQPLFYPQLMHQFAMRGYTVFSLDTIPRTTRAQSMDVLSSQANIAGYKAVLLAAMEYSRYLPML